MRPLLPSPARAKNLQRKAAENHWLIYLLVISPVLFRASRWAIAVSTGRAAEPLSILEIGLLLAVIYQVYLRWLFQRKPPVAICRSDVFVFLFVLAAALSVVALLYEPVDHSTALKAFLRLMEYVALYLIISTNIQSWRAIRKLLIVLVGCGVAVSAFAVLQYFLGPMATTNYFPWGTWWAAFDPSKSFRAYSFFWNPLYVAAYVAIIWPINLGLLMAERGGRNRRLYLAALMLNCGGLFITFSRSAIVGLAVALFVFAKERARLAIAGGLLSLLVGSFLIPKQLRVRLFLEDQESRESVLVRIERYKEGLKLYSTHPLLGVGFGNYQTYYSGSAPDTADMTYARATYTEAWRYNTRREDIMQYTAENTFLQYAGEMGSFGTIVFLALCGHFLRLLWKLRKKSAASDIWTAGLFAGLLSFLACSMFATLTAVEMNSMFWVLLGISKALWLTRPRPELNVGNGLSGFRSGKEPRAWLPH